MRPPPDIAASIQRALQVLRAISTCAAVDPGLRAAAADAMVDCAAPEDFSTELEGNQVRRAQIKGLTVVTALFESLNEQTVLEHDLQNQVTRALECLQSPEALRRWARWARDSANTSGPAAWDGYRIGFSALVPPRRVQSLVDHALARVGITADDERRRQALAVAALLRAHASGALLRHVADRSADPLLMWALPQHPDLLTKVREAAHTDGPHAKILRRVIDVIDWRTR